MGIHVQYNLNTSCNGNLVPDWVHDGSYLCWLGYGAVFVLSGDLKFVFKMFQVQVNQMIKIFNKIGVRFTSA